MTINYDQKIVDATKRIANYYMQKLLDKRGRYSVEMYGYMEKQIEKMLAGSTKADYYLQSSWFAYRGPVPDLDLKTWNKVVMPFFQSAREYIEHKQGGYVRSDDEKKLAVAIEKLYTRIGKNIEPLRVNPKQQTIDYAKTVADTVEKIASYYEARLKKIESKISERKYLATIKGINDLRKEARVGNADFFLHYGWMNSGIIGNLKELDPGIWDEYLLKFFNIVREYIDAKGRGFLVTDEEKKVMRIVKLINLKIAGGLFAGIKDMILPDSYFMVRQGMER